MIPAVSRLVYRCQERAVGRPTFAYLRDLERSQWRSREEVEALQMAKLLRLLRLAQRHSPWHAARMARAGLDPAGLERITLEQLRRLPLMDKEDARRHREEIVWRGVPGGAHRYNTGGSSGRPLVFYFGRWRQASDAAGRMRARRWWGVEPGDKEVYLWGAPVELTKTDWVKAVRDRWVNQLVLNAFEMSPAAMDRYAEAIRRFRPRCIYGYATSIALLARRAEQQGADLRLPSLRVVCTTGEPLYPDQRQVIGRVFGCPVANEYGSRDIGFTAHEAPSGQMLLMSESILLEVVDREGQPVPPGTPGEAVMTGLCSEAQPFVRYRTGDLVTLSPEGCREGRGLHVLAQVGGRTTDLLVRPDGTVMHALAVIYVLRATDGVEEFRVRQTAVDRLEVAVVPTAAWDRSVEAAVRSGLQARMGPGVEVRIETCDRIPPDPSGKFRYVVSDVPLPEGLDRDRFAAAAAGEAT
ncbi:MAG: phenylacetate--CoA ligase family protein [Nitrospirae bacterium]|nr:MAG: phenylacetate--CoA ligase family protein [Nitrospirota bacterium]